MTSLKTVILAALAVAAVPAITPQAAQAAGQYSVASGWRCAGYYGTYYAAENVASFLRSHYGYETSIKYKSGSGWILYYR